MQRLVSLSLCVALLVPMVGRAAPPPRPPPAPPPADLPPPPPPPPPAHIECFPACRSGFFCYQGQCRSACNPPCAAGQQCLESGQCVGGGARPPAPTAPDDAPLAPRVAGPPQGPMVSDDGEQAPPGYHFETKRKKGLLVAGPVLFGVGYIFSVVYGVFGYLFASLNTGGFVFLNRSTYLVYAIPIAGPGLSQFLFATSFGYRSTGRDFEFLFAGIVTALQVSGLTLGLLGAFLKGQVLVEDRYTSTNAPPPVRWSISPFAPGAPLGVTLSIQN